MICFNPGTTLTHSSFKNVFKSSTICQKFFTEISSQMVSIPYINNIKNSLLMLKSNLVPRICTGCKVITCQSKTLRILGTKLLISEKKNEHKNKKINIINSTTIYFSSQGAEEATTIIDKENPGLKVNVIKS